ncbi:MAG: heme-binding protein [Hyphomicrobiaceae bacterium]
MTATRPPDYGTPIALSDALRVIAAAEAQARKMELQVTVAIVDPGGHLVCLHRIDNCQFGSIEVAEAKARTAVAFRRPSKALQDSLAQSPRLLALPAMPIDGGLPIIVGGKIAGGIGVSGAKSEEDSIIAEAGLKALS